MSVVINPRTQRPVKVGSRTWRKLVSDGIIGQPQEPHDENQLYTLRPNDDTDEKIQELNSALPPTVQAVRGRGRYRGQLVKRRRQPSTERVAKHTIQKTAEKLQDREVYESLHSEDRFDTALEDLIMRELSNTIPLQAPPDYTINDPLPEESETEEGVVEYDADSDHSDDDVVEDDYDDDYE